MHATMMTITDPAAEIPARTKRARLAGHAGLAAFGKDLLPGYVEQIDVRASYAPADWLSPPTLTVGIHRSLVDGPLRRAVYAIEGALDYALKHSRRGTLAVLAAEVGTGVIYADILVARGRKLIEHIERQFPARDDPGCDEAIKVTLTQLRKDYPTAQFVQAGAEALDLAGAPYIGAMPAKARPILAGARSVKQQLMMPILVAAAGLAVYVGALAIGWGQYSRAQRDYAAAAADPVIAKAGGIDNAALDVLQQRKLYIDEPRRQVVLAEKAAQIVTGISAVSGVHIISMSLPGPAITASQQYGVLAAATAKAGADAPRAPDVRLVVSVPRSGTNALDQAQVLMQQLAAATGLSLRLEYAGWRDAGDARQYTMEGFVDEKK